MSNAGQGLCQAWALGDRSGYGFLFWRLVGPLVVIFHRSTFFNLCFLFPETMVNERPSAVGVLDKHRQKAAERKGRRSLEVMPPVNEVAAQPRERAGPSQKSKKRPREGSNIATTCLLYTSDAADE